MFQYTERKLARDIRRVVSTLDPSLHCEYRPAHNEVALFQAGRAPDGDERPTHTIFLGNLLAKLSAMGRRERLPQLKAFLHECLCPQPLGADDFITSLALRVRTPFEVALRCAMLSDHDQSRSPNWVSRHRGDLIVELVNDRPESVSAVQPSQLVEHSVSVEEAFEIAAAALRRTTDGNQWHELDEGLWLSTYQDDYDFARIIADAEARFPVNDPAIFSPSHSICLVCDQSDPQSVEAMLEYGNQLSAQHRPLSQALWVAVEQGVWRRWVGSPDSAVASLLSLQEAREMCGNYDELTGFLERKETTQGQVASFQVMQSDGEFRSFCVYNANQLTYLPRTDFVALQAGSLDDRLTGWLLWDDFINAPMLSADALAESVLPMYTVQPLSDEGFAALSERCVTNV
ncbi:MAG: hypothetical protein AAF493_19020 [Pseudomonadota bacterium]